MEKDDTAPRTIHIQPYGEHRLFGFNTVAYLSGNVPHLFLRIGSDAVRFPEGQCLPVPHNHVNIVNPYPRAAEITICRGLPVNISPERGVPSNLQAANMVSGIASFNPGAAGLKWAYGVMMKRGSAQLECYEPHNDGFTSVMIFPRASANFMAHKPAGCMEETAAFRYHDGREDSAVHCVAGTYTDAMVGQWIAASGYQGTPVTVKHGSYVSSVHRYSVEVDQAVFFVRDASRLVHCFGRLQHRGAGLEEFQ